MSISEAFVLGTVQGLTEFLPVSSSGHLVLFQKLFGLSENVLTFDIAVHLATLIAIVFVFYQEIGYIFKHPFSKWVWLLLVGTIPAIVFGFFFKQWIEFLFESGHTLGIEFIFTGLVLWSVESLKQNPRKTLEDMSTVDALVIGTAQAFAILPAVSRSGLTISGALFRGLDRAFAAKFSFLLSIPAILGAVVLDLPDAIKTVSSHSASTLPLSVLFVGMVSAGISGFLAIRWMIHILKKKNLKGFAVYVILLGVLILCEQIISGKLFGPLWK